MVDARRSQADLGHRRHLPLVFHASHARRHPLDEIAVQAGGHTAIHRPSAVNQREQGPIQILVRATELALDEQTNTLYIGLTDRVDALGGTIDVASPVGAGTTLLIRLPIEEG